MFDREGTESELLCQHRHPCEWDHPLDGAAGAPARVVGVQGGSQGKVERGREPRCHLSRLLNKQESLYALLQLKTEAKICLGVEEVWEQGMPWLLFNESQCWEISPPEQVQCYC